MAWTFVKTKTFIKSFDKLPAPQQALAEEVFKKVFKHNPYDPSLKPHKIHKLSSRYRCPVLGIHIEGNLIVAFREESGSLIVSLDIGTHSIYK